MKKCCFMSSSSSLLLRQVHDIQIRICQYLNTPDLVHSFLLTCKYYYHILFQKDKLWRTIYVDCKFFIFQDDGNNEKKSSSSSASLNRIFGWTGSGWRLLPTPPPQISQCSWVRLHNTLYLFGSQRSIMIGLALYLT